jgi:glycosyltransferase involved in cell wall biosynthesis
MKILYFYPENLLLKDQGNHSRALAQLEYFKDSDFEVHFVGIHSEYFTEDAFQEFKKRNLIKEGHLLKKIKKGLKIKYFFQFSILRKLKIYLKDFDRTAYGQDKQFKKILQKNEFDFIFFSYAYWENLIDLIVKYKKGSTTIIDTHDFITSQFQDKKNFEIGTYFRKELSILKKFDKVIVISIDEKYLFTQFLKNEVIYIPHYLTNNSSLKKHKSTIDILYVASDNEHNINSAKWFFNNVYPLLDSNLRLTVIGKITQYIDDYENVTKINFVENLNEIYTETKISICPMLSGTGLKIKVIEALSFGIPVVTNERGVDGFANKSKNGCWVNNSNFDFANAIKILLNDSNTYQIAQIEAIKCFEDHFEKNKIHSTYDSLFKIR